MTWDYAEANPFAEAGGDMASSAIAIAKVLDNLPPDGYRAGTRVEQADAVVGTVAGALISTDPPYYDNIGYADLSDFFYVWLRRTLIDVFPRELTTVLVPKTAELIAAPYRHGGRDKAKEFFQDGMTRALSNMARNTVPGVPAAVYYAFKQTESDEAGESSTGWETFLEAVIAAGFEVHGTWPIRTEKAGRSVEIGSNALASSVILACSPRPVDAETSTRTDFRRSLSVELPVALRALQASGIAPVDVAQAAIGPGMAIFSRYAKVLEPDGKPMTVRSALRVINEMLDEHLTAHEGNFDSHTRFAVTWYESHGFESGPYGDAETLATARAVAIGGMAEAGILKSGGGKVRLLKRSELPGDWDPSTDARLTVWEAAQHLIKQLEEHGEEAAAALLAKLGAHGDAARDLAYRLYSTCERKKWAEEARAYNGLVVAWPDLERLASSHAKSDTGSGQQSLL